MGWDSREFNKTEDKSMEGVAERRQQRKIFGGKKESRIRCICCQKKSPGKKFYQLESSDSRNFIFKLAKRMKHEHHDIVGDKYVKNDKGCVTCNDSAKLKAWKSHFERHLNVELVRNKDSLLDLEPKIGPPPCITNEMISKAIAKVKNAKAVGPFGIVIEMVRSACK